MMTDGKACGSELTRIMSSWERAMLSTHVVLFAYVTKQKNISL